MEVSSSQTFIAKTHLFPMLPMSHIFFIFLIFFKGFIYLLEVV